MNTLRTWIVGSIATLTLLGCSNAFKDISVETATDERVDLAGYRSYAWAAAATLVHDPDYEWTALDMDIGAEIMFLVDRELRAHGMTEAAASPDALVIYAVGVDMKAMDVVMGPDDTIERFEQIPKGALVVVLADSETRRVMWVGSALAELVEEPTIEIRKKRLDYAISKMFKKFPR